VKEPANENNRREWEKWGASPEFPKQAGGAQAQKAGVQRRAWTERVLKPLAQSQERAERSAAHGRPSLRGRLGATASIPNGKPPTGEPDAGDLPVRFGGRGADCPASLPLYNSPGQAHDSKRRPGLGEVTTVPRAYSRLQPALNAERK
jgi:hypothetical protein